MNDYFEKVEKSLNDFGGYFFAIGWIILIASSLLLIMSILTNFSVTSFKGWGATDLVVFIIEAIVFIILSSRIKNNVLDKNNKVYLIVFLIIYTASIFLNIINASTGSIGISIILFIYIITTLSSLNKALKEKEFRFSLESPMHKFNKREWIIFGVLSVALICIGLWFDLNYNRGLWKSDKLMSNEEFIELTVDGLKNEISLPYKIDEITTLTAIASGSDSIKYYYKLSSDSILNNPSLVKEIRESSIDNTCNGKEMDIFFDRGISLEMIYQDSLQTKTIIIKKEDCL
ncbi:MAG: hypothetical protein WC319_02240 [Candidatus Paceibacterota bacterium]|jgi:hypothetical protein